MKIDDCDLRADAVLSYPLSHDRPEPEWERAFEGGSVPRPLFEFYCHAKYFSFGSAPEFLSDPEHLAFAYLKNTTIGVREGLEQAPTLITEMRNAMRDQYTPEKRFAGLPYRREASDEMLRAFKYLLVELSGVLDAVSETAAILFFRQIPDLRLGRASFSRLARFAETPPTPLPAVAGPREVLVGEFQRVLKEEVFPSGEAKDWWPLFSMYRNKLAHIGGRMLVTYGFPSADRSDRYTFLPNRWPFMLEQLVSSGGTGTAPLTPTESVIGVDILEYAEGLVARVIGVVGRSFDVFTRLYDSIVSTPIESDLISALKASFQRYEFRRFP